MMSVLHTIARTLGGSVRRLIFLLVFGALAVMHFTGVAPLDVLQKAVPGFAVPVAQDVAWSRGEENDATKNAYQHFRKHGADFGFTQPDQYYKAALDFVTTPPAGTLSVVQADGDIVFYNPDLNWFVVKNREGVPRTFFQPDPTIHGYPTNMDYFKAQTERR
jgi:pyocin large subunit-like protein